MGNSTSQWEDFVHSFPLARKRASYSPPPTLSLRLISNYTWANYIEQYRKYTFFPAEVLWLYWFWEFRLWFWLPVFILFMVCFVLVGCGRYFINLSLLVFFFLSFFCITFYHFVMYVLVAVKKKICAVKAPNFDILLCEPRSNAHEYTVHVNYWTATPLETKVKTSISSFLLFSYFSLQKKLYPEHIRSRTTQINEDVDGSSGLTKWEKC